MPRSLPKSLIGLQVRIAEDHGRGSQIPKEKKTRTKIMEGEKGERNYVMRHDIFASWHISCASRLSSRWSSSFVDTVNCVKIPPFLKRVSNGGDSSTTTRMSLYFFPRGIPSMDHRIIGGFGQHLIQFLHGHGHGNKTFQGGQTNGRTGIGGRRFSFVCHVFVYHQYVPCCCRD